MMTNRFPRRVSFWVALFLFVGLCVYSQSAVRLVLIVAADNWYYDTTDCDQQGRRCVSIVSETHASLNSEVKKYFYPGGWFHVPLLNRRYIGFGDGAEFCFLRAGESGFAIYASEPAFENNLPDVVKVYPLEKAARGCRVNSY